MRPPVEKITKNVREWFKGRTIERVKVVRPTKEERRRYEYTLGPSALKIIFTDGASVVLDSWIGNFKLVSPKFGTQNVRARSYFTVTRKEDTDDSADE